MGIHEQRATTSRFPPNIEATAYFVIAEALTNAAKHAQGSKATVSIATHDDHLVIDVSDDGVGGADNGGSGLRGLTDRVAAAGGSIAIDSPPRSGNRSGGRRGAPWAAEDEQSR